MQKMPTSVWQEELSTHWSKDIHVIIRSGALYVAHNYVTWPVGCDKLHQKTCELGDSKYMVMREKEMRTKHWIADLIRIF